MQNPNRETDQEPGQNVDEKERIQQLEQEVINELDTGDIILFSRQCNAMGVLGGALCFIAKVFPSPFAHLLHSRPSVSGITWRRSWRTPRPTSPTPSKSRFAESRYSTLPSPSCIVTSSQGPYRPLEGSSHRCSISVRISSPLLSILDSSHSRNERASLEKSQRTWRQTLHNWNWRLSPRRSNESPQALPLPSLQP